jgi:hypothetical protein
LLAAACGGGSSPPAERPSSRTWAVVIDPLAPPAAVSSFAPQVTSSRDGVTASWVEQTGEKAALRFSERTSSGWSPAKTVVSGSGWFLSHWDPPTVLRLSNGTLAADWFVTTREEIEAYDTYMSYSKDNGQSWITPFKPHRDRTTTQHGFTTLFEMPGQGLGLVWLDGRDMENNTTDPEGGVMTLRFTSFDSAWKQGPDMSVNTRVCECCQTAAVVTPGGVLAAFRDRSDKEIRDIAVSRLENGAWTPAQIVHNDNWEVFTCPVNGPALSARGNDVAVAWFTLEQKAGEEEGHAYAAFSHDAGRTWSAPIRLDENRSRGYVDIEMLDDGGAVATWVEFSEQRQRFTMRRVDPSGAASAPIVIAGTGPGRVAGYPRMARHQDELVFAWTESVMAGEGQQPSQQVKGAVARLQK